MQTHASTSQEEVPASFRLVVLGRGAPVTHVLAAGSAVLIGRSDTANVRIDEDSISRRHALLQLGDTITVEDLGSLNGTRVRERALKKGAVVEIAAGEAFEVGKVMCIVQHRGAARPPVRILRTHSYVDSRLEEEIDKGALDRTALARLQLDGAITAAALQACITTALLPTDLIAQYAPGELEVLFIDSSIDDVQQRCELFALALRAHVKVRVGVALFGRDGRSAAALWGAANAGVTGTSDVAASGAPLGAAMERLKRLVERVAHSDISIILHGETGVGKEVLARQLHAASERATKPFIGLNCAALTESLLESELFGHERGAFSGAVAMKPGLLEVAAGGTVFLDEVGEMSVLLQTKLLRVIEERQVQRVGGLAPRTIDVRFIAASHRDLEQDVDDGRFRQDLYFRLNGITLEIPPLRERLDEIGGLVQGFLLEACRRQKRLDSPRVSADAMQLLRAYAWPGNVRELKNVVERAVLLCTGSAIGPEHLPAEKMLAHARASRPTRPPVSRDAPRASERSMPTARANDPWSSQHGTETHALPARLRRNDNSASFGDERSNSVNDATANHPTGDGVHKDISLKEAVAGTERDKILDTLRQCAGNQTKAAEVLGISRRTLLNRLDQYGVPRPRKDPQS